MTSTEKNQSDSIQSDKLDSKTDSIQSDKLDSKTDSIQSDTKTDKSDEDDDIPPQYGVCDSPDQFAKKFSKWKGYIITTKIERKNQPPVGGMRFHKHGPYVGLHDITEEYFYDTNIDVIYTFTTHESQYLSRGIWYYIKDGKAEYMSEYATSTYLLQHVTDAFLKANSLKADDIKKLDLQNNYDDSYYDTYNTTYKNNIVVFIQRLWFQRRWFFSKLGYYLDDTIIENTVNFFLCIHNIEMFYDEKIDDIINKIYIGNTHNKRSEIDFYYSLTTDEQERLVDFINRYNAKMSMRK